jgi:hypothetical protein
MSLSSLGGGIPSCSFILSICVLPMKYYESPTIVPVVGSSARGL